MKLKNDSRRNAQVVLQHGRVRNIFKMRQKIIHLQYSQQYMRTNRPVEPASSCHRKCSFAGLNSVGAGSSPSRSTGKNLRECGDAPECSARVARSRNERIQVAAQPIAQSRKAILPNLGHPGKMVRESVGQRFRCAVQIHAPGPGCVGPHVGICSRQPRRAATIRKNPARAPGLWKIKSRPPSTRKAEVIGCAPPDKLCAWTCIPFRKKVASQNILRLNVQCDGHRVLQRAGNSSDGHCVAPRR